MMKGVLGAAGLLSLLFHNTLAVELTMSDDSEHLPSPTCLDKGLD